MKKMMKSETMSVDAAHLESESVSIITSETIEEEKESNGEDSDKE